MVLVSAEDEGGQAVRGPSQFLAVPEQAVIDSGTKKVVYVEREPGIFEGVEVELGPRSGDYYAVVKGLMPGDRIAAAGGFLIDAETRLNPAAASTYFGSSGGSQPAGRPSVPVVPKTHPSIAPPAGQPPAPASRVAAAGPAEEAMKNLGALSEEDRNLARAQRRCPITGAAWARWARRSRLPSAASRCFSAAGCKAKAKTRARRDPQKGRRFQGGKDPMIEKIIEFSIRNRFLVVLLSLGVIVWGIYAVINTPIDAIPDLSENQVIVFTDWMGRSPKEIEDQITYPLSASLQGWPGVKAVRSSSMFNFSMISIIFEDNTDFYFSRQQVSERLALGSTFLPPGVEPHMAPDATALGQIFWYTVEGKGHDLGRLRRDPGLQRRLALKSVPGVADVASAGGFPIEYQIDVDPNKLRAYGVTLGELFNAVARSNSAVGGKVVQKANEEFIVRGVGWLATPRTSRKPWSRPTRKRALRSTSRTWGPSAWGPSFAAACWKRTATRRSAAWS